MRPAATNPHSRKYDANDDLILCPECHAWMLPLSDFELSSAAESPTLDADGFELALFGL